MGRTKIELKEKDYTTIRKLASRGVKETDMCKALGVSFPTWARLKEEDEKAIEVFEEAKKIEEDKLVGVLYDAATKDKNLTAAMFLLKTRHGYKEGAEQVNANQVNVSITLPGAKDPVQYLKEIEENGN